MEIYKNEKEFNLHERLGVRVNRNDFDELGSILEIELGGVLGNNSGNNLNNLNNGSTNHISHMIIMSFYDYNQIQLSQNQLVLLTNHESIFFDNVLIINTNSGENILLKLLNKEIYYMKIYASTSIMSNERKNGKNQGPTPNNFTLSNLTSTQLLDVYHLESLDVKSLTQMKQKYSSLCSNNQSSNDKIDKNEHFNLIIKELNQVNLSLINEKEQIEKTKLNLKVKEDQIASMIINFKKEIMLHSDKLFNEAAGKLNLKINDMQKKLTATENNVMNKYKIVKEKLNSKGGNISNNSGSNTKEFKEKLANLEIKNKFLEDSISNLKSRIIEKEEMIKNFIESEDKLNKLLKKLKDENFGLVSKIKSFESEQFGDGAVGSNKSNNENFNLKNKKNKKGGQNLKSNSNQVTSNQSNIQTQNQIPSMKSGGNKNKFEIGKILIQQYSEIFIIEMLIDKNQQNNFYQITLNDKEASICANILLHISLNPIQLFQKFPFSIIFVIRKISALSSFSDNSKIISEYVNDVINLYHDLRKGLVQNNSSNISGHENLSVSNTTNNFSYTFSQPNNPNNSVLPSTRTIYSNYKPLLNFETISHPINLNEILTQKITYFHNYFGKNEKKYLDKNNYAMFILISLSTLIFKIMITSDVKEIRSTVKFILEKTIYEKDYFSINYLVKLNYFEVLLNVINKIDQKENFADMMNIFINSVLFVYSMDITNENPDLINRRMSETIISNKNILDYIEKGINRGDNKIVILAGLISKNVKLSDYLGGREDLKSFSQNEEISSESENLFQINLSKIINV